MRLSAAGFIVLCTVANGCVYLHNDANQKVAEQAQESFSDTTKSPLYGNAPANLQKFLDIREGVTNDLSQADQNIQLAGYLGKTWGAAESDTATALERAKSALSSAKEGKKNAEEHLKNQLAALPGVEGEIKTIIDALNAAERSRAQFIATQKLLSSGIAAIATTQPSIAVNTLKEALEGTLPVPKYYLDKQGILATTQPTKSSVGELTGIPARLFADRTAGTTGVKFALQHVELFQGLGNGLTFKDQGIATITISLGYDLARAEEMRLRTEIAYARKKLDLYQAYIAFLTGYTQRLENQLKGSAGISAAAVDAGNKQATIRETLERKSIEAQAAYHAALIAPTKEAREEAFARRKNSRSTLHSTLIALVTNFELCAIENQKVDSFNRHLSALDAQRELELAVARLKEREAVIGRGLSGLVAFHSNGISREDISHIIGIAQAIGIFRIAGKL